MKSLIALAPLLFAFPVFAAQTTYEVEGMHCSACAKMIESKVCTMDGLEKCEVSLGKIVISPKTGVTITKKQIEEATAKAGDYKIVGEKQEKAK